MWVRIGVAVVVVFTAITMVLVVAVVGIDVERVEDTATRQDRREAAKAQRGPEPVEGAGPAPTGDPQVDAVLDEIARFVEVARGLAFQQPVEVEVLDSAAFEQRLFATVEKDAEELRKDAQALQALDFVDDVGEVEQGMRTLLAAGVLGFYDPETDELVVRGSDLGPLTRQSIAHELVHALDDQWFDLGRPEFERRDDEVGFGVTALAEGDARRIERRYEAQLDEDDRRRLEAEEAALPSADLASVPRVLVDLMVAPYDLGEKLVKRVLERGDQPALDEQFRNPPRTTEQVIEPEKLFAGEAAQAVAPPPADGPVIDQGVFGELMLRLLLQRSFNGRRVIRASSGWGGDQYVVWPQGANYCIRIDFAMDTAGDVDELHDTFTDLVKELPAAQVDRPQPDHVRLTSCN